MLPAHSYASSDLDDSWQWSGFITQGWSISDRNNFFGNSSDSNGSFDFRELGINGIYSVSPQLRLSGQLLSRTAGKGEDGDVQVDYLFADWSFLQNNDRQAGVRFGRLKNPIGFYNDTRDVSFTRPSIVLPQSIYPDQVRELELSSDGVGGYYRTQPSYGSWMVDVLWGKPLTGADTERALLGADLPGVLGSSELALARVLYEHGSGQIRLAATFIDANTSFTSDIPFFIGNGEIDFELFGYSAQLNFENLSLTSEYFIENISRSGFGSFLPKQDNTIKAYYIQAEYRFDHRWTGLLRYDDAVVDDDDPDGTNLQLMTGRPAHQGFAKDWTIGIGYQVTPKLHTRAELHHVEGTAWLSALDNESPGELKKNWNMLMFQASYRF
ncbi:hypothetical protein BGP75_14470 [Motiliproteus sp. MSK22-1]|nr:hypothetical protein BGP75_14470 [Motiliproteus sp. MSK22-1]